MTFREFSGKNVEEAIRAAMKEFSADLGDLDIEILAQGSRGILGVGGEEARILAAPKSAVAAADTVRVDTRPTPSEEPGEDRGEEPGPPDAEAAHAGESPAPAEPDDELGEAGADDQRAELARADAGRRPRGGRGRNGRTRGGRERGPRGDRADRPERPRTERPDRGERGTREPAPFVPGKPLDELSEEERAVVDEAKGILEELLRLMEVQASVEVVVGRETARLNVQGDDLGVLIGRRGEKLASLQHIVNLIVAKREGLKHRIAIDVENYRGRREDQLRDVAERAAARVIQTGKIIQLEAMPALERRIVHLALVDHEKVRTQSVGVDPNRRVVVLPAGSGDRG